MPSRGQLIHMCILKIEIPSWVVCLNINMYGHISQLLQMMVQMELKQYLDTFAFRYIITVYTFVLALGIIARAPCKRLNTCRTWHSIQYSQYCMCTVHIMLKQNCQRIWCQLIYPMLWLQLLHYQSNTHSNSTDIVFFCYVSHTVCPMATLCRGSIYSNNIIYSCQYFYAATHKYHVSQPLQQILSEFSHVHTYTDMVTITHRESLTPKPTQ